jgi:hypothetical protein
MSWPFAQLACALPMKSDQRVWLPSAPSQLAAYDAHSSDFGMALDCARHFIELTDRPSVAPILVLESLATTVVMRYAAPFAKGRAEQLEIDSYGGIKGLFYDVHDHLINVRNKWIAHPIRKKDRCRVYLRVREEPETGYLTPVAVTGGTVTRLPLLPHEVAGAVPLLEAWLNAMSSRCGQEAKALWTTAQALSQRELQALEMAPASLEMDPRRLRAL